MFTPQKKMFKQQKTLQNVCTKALAFYFRFPSSSLSQVLFNVLCLPISVSVSFSLSHTHTHLPFLKKSFWWFCLFIFDTCIWYKIWILYNSKKFAFYCCLSSTYFPFLELTTVHHCLVFFSKSALCISKHT